MLNYTSLRFTKIVSGAVMAIGLLSTTIAQAACPLTPADRGYVKWYPGHYQLLGNDKSETQAARIADFLSRYNAVSTMRGVQIVYDWRALEPTPGNYKLDEVIGPDIAKMADKGKKLAIVVGYKFTDSLPPYILSYTPKMVDGIMVPAFYVQDGEGDYATGYVANLGHPDTFARFKQLLIKIAEKYDNNGAVGKHVASVSFVETAPGRPLPSAEKLILNKGVMNMDKFAGCTFKHTPLIQNVNYPRNMLQEFTAIMKDYGVGLGGPDVFYDALNRGDSDLAFGVGRTPLPYDKGIYLYHPEMANKVAIGMQVHNENLKYATHEDYTATPKRESALDVKEVVKRVYKTAANDLFSNFVFWQTFGMTSDYLENYLKKKPGFDSADIKGFPLRTGCPPSYKTPTGVALCQN